MWTRAVTRGKRKAAAENIEGRISNISYALDHTHISTSSSVAASFVTSQALRSFTLA